MSRPIRVEAADGSQAVPWSVTTHYFIYLCYAGATGVSDIQSPLIIDPIIVVEMITKLKGPIKGNNLQLNILVICAKTLNCLIEHDYFIMTEQHC